MLDWFVCLEPFFRYKYDWWGRILCDTSIRIQLSPTGQIKVKLSDTMDQVILKPSWSQFYVKCITLSHFDMLISISLEQQLIPNWQIGFNILFVIFS